MRFFRKLIPGLLIAGFAFPSFAEVISRASEVIPREGLQFYDNGSPAGRSPSLNITGSGYSLSQVNGVEILNLTGVGTSSVSNADGTITITGIFGGVDVKLAALTNGHILVGNASNKATDVAVSGVVNISNAGVTSFGSFASAVLVTALTDETGNGSVVFSNSPTLVTPALGTPSALVGTNITGSGASFNAGTATALAANGTNCSAGNYPLGVDASGNSESCTAAATGTVTSVAGTASRVTSTGGATPQIDISATFEALLGKVATGLQQFAATTSAQLAGVISDETGSGALVFGTSPAFTTPNIGSATGSISGNAGTATALAANGTNCSAGNYPLGVDASGNSESCTAAATGTVTSVAGTASRVTSTGGATPQIDISATFEALLGKVATGLQQFAATTSAQLAGVISDETGSGALVFGTSPTLVTPALGTPASGVMTNATGTATGLTSGITNALKSATTTVDVSAATAPSANQVLTATDSTHATWQASSGGVSAGAVLQTLQVVKTDTSTLTGTSFQTVPSMSQAITPASSSNKVLVMVYLNASTDTSQQAYCKIQRAGSDISGAIGASPGSRTAVTGAMFTASGNSMQGLTMIYLDNPATTSSTAYTIVCATPGAGTAIYINRTNTDSNSTGVPRSISTITLQEIKG